MKKSIEMPPEITELLNKIQEKLAVVEQKINILISKPSPKPPESRPPSVPYREYHHRRDHADSGNRNNFRERVLYKAICAECKQSCEVPFKPTGERPVYCKECFAKRRAGSSFNERPDNRPREEAHPQADHAQKRHGSDKRRAAPRKKASSKRRKKY